MKKDAQQTRQSSKILQKPPSQPIKTITNPLQNAPKTKKQTAAANKKTKKNDQYTRKDEKMKKLRKSCTQGCFWIFSLLSVPSGAIRYQVSLLEYHSLICNASGESYALSCWLRQTDKNSLYLLRLELTIGLDAERSFPKAPANCENKRH